ncbi:hypothetical protein BAU07_00965 [Bordetella flabilis]|uniref:Uncharacterized protein n=1 Tax=Bordetella flabilis TaxID=463014 RepID=A0A193G891_9BORD|nr:hypothetical protein [Bordetella flabilis]ANN75883.1 hypothetical protein BAU07_00965 [Bordetella flabilis]
MQSTTLERQLGFPREIDRLKTVMRQSPLLDGSRKENSAEHPGVAIVSLAADLGKAQLGIQRDVLVHLFVGVEGDRGEVP